MCLCSAVVLLLTTAVASSSKLHLEGDAMTCPSCAPPCFEWHNVVVHAVQCTCSICTLAAVHLVLLLTAAATDWCNLQQHKAAHGGMTKAQYVS